MSANPAGQSSASDSDSADHYAALGLGSDASLADIRKAYRQQASLHHPDKSQAANAAQRFRAVQRAYEVLSDAQKRQDYDDNRRRNLLDDPLAAAQTLWNQALDHMLQNAPNH